MPSVGSKSVAARLSLSSASLSGAALLWPGITRAILRLDLGGDLGHGRELVGRPFDMQHLRAVLGIVHPLGDRALPLPGHVPRTLPSAASKVGSGIHALAAPAVELDARDEECKLRRPFRHRRVGGLCRGESAVRDQALLLRRQAFGSSGAIWFEDPLPLPEAAGESGRAVDKGRAAVPNRSASHATADCTGWRRIAGPRGGRQWLPGLASASPSASIASIMTNEASDRTSAVRLTSLRSLVSSIQRSGPSSAASLLTSYKAEAWWSAPSAHTDRARRCRAPYWPAGSAAG